MVKAGFGGDDRWAEDWHEVYDQNGVFQAWFWGNSFEACHIIERTGGWWTHHPPSDVYFPDTFCPYGKKPTVRRALASPAWFASITPGGKTLRGYLYTEPPVACRLDKTYQAGDSFNRVATFDGRLVGSLQSCFGG